VAGGGTGPVPGFPSGFSELTSFWQADKNTRITRAKSEFFMLTFHLIIKAL
jgi:hypothetical protein